MKKQIAGMKDLELQPEEFRFLKETCYYLKAPYLDFLRGYRFDPEEVTVTQNGNMIQVRIEGYWYRTILWEVPLMAVMSELYFKMTNQQVQSAEIIKQRTEQKIKRLEAIGARFSDFGTRRRFSFENHDLVVASCKKYAPVHFTVTSNPYLAMKYGCKPI